MVSTLTWDQWSHEMTVLQQLNGPYHYELSIIDDRLHIQELRNSGRPKILFHHLAATVYHLQELAEFAKGYFESLQSLNSKDKNKKQMQKFQLDYAHFNHGIYQIYNKILPFNPFRKILQDLHKTTDDQRTKIHQYMIGVRI